MIVWLLGAWLVGGALAQEAAVPATRGPAPALRTVAFQARPDGACDDRGAARRGACVDVVDFFPLRGPGPRPAHHRAVLREVGPLYAWLFEDLAYRWPAGDLEATLRADGYVALPSMATTWGRGTDVRAAWALPARDTELVAERWSTPGAPPELARVPGVFYPHVRYRGPEGQTPPPPTVVLRGRFAQRLGFAGKVYDYDLMDADPSASAPFFEQIFPFEGSTLRFLEATDAYDRAELAPLMEFRFPRDLQRLDADDPHLAGVLVGRDWEDARAAAAASFERFLRVVTVQTAQYAMEDYTTNQMRVLTAITAMGAPPSGSELQGGTRDLVAAARGETDVSGERLGRGEPVVGSAAAASELQVRVGRLPRDVVAPWVQRLASRSDLASLMPRIRDEIARALAGQLRPDAPPLTSLDDDVRTRWLSAAAYADQDRTETDARVLQLALGVLLEDMPPSQRARISSWLLADHVRWGIAGSFDPTKHATPREVVDGATARWSAVMNLHGHRPEQVPQGYGAIDPTAICTRADGLAALDEPAFRAITVDQLVPARPGLSGEAVLDDAADLVPFLFLDDPSVRPEVSALVDLGDGRTLYRVRWRVWSGWHLLWSKAPFDNARERLVLRTGALCDDMVFAPAELVPTVVRAGLLNANFRPSTPERGGGGKRKPVEPLDADAVAGTLEDAPGQVQKAKGALDKAEAALASPPLADLASKPPSFSQRSYELVQEELRPETRWVRDLVHGPLEKVAPGEGLLLVVVDATAPSPRERIADTVPRTPYVRGQQPVRVSGAERPDADARFVRTAAWAWYFAPSRGRPVQVSPGYTAKESVTSGDRPPRWSRRRTVDMGFGIGVAGAPLHRAFWECTDGLPNVAACPDEEPVVDSQAFGADLQAYATWWFHDRPRFALDAGLEARLDVRPGGPALRLSGAEPVLDDELDYPWGLRFQAGLVLGIRQAVAPRPLHGGRPTAPVWGAPQQDGRSRATRFEWGVRTGLLLGPGFTGVETSTLGELWGAWSVRSKRNSNASFTPYHPLVGLGPFARFSYTFGPATAEERPYRLKQSWTASLGLRLQLRLKKAAKLPEVGS